MAHLFSILSDLSNKCVIDTVLYPQYAPIYPQLFTDVFEYIGAGRENRTPII